MQYKSWRYSVGRYEIGVLLARGRRVRGFRLECKRVSDSDIYLMLRIPYIQIQVNWDKVIVHDWESK